MLKIACLLTGDDYKLLSTDTPASRKKVMALALAMLVPVTIWLINGYLLANVVLRTSQEIAIITSFLCGFIVFMVEKLIVMAKGNGWLKLTRVCISVIVALLGSIAMDEVVFEEDIDNAVADMKNDFVLEQKTKAEQQFHQLHDYGSLESQINQARSSYEAAEAAVINEANGTHGTGKRGVGIITALKDRKAIARKQDLQVLEANKAALDQLKNSDVNQAMEEAKNSFRTHALLTRIKALFHLIGTSGVMKFVYVLFTLLMFFFEFLVIILKSTWDKTNYETRVEMIEEIGKKRMDFLRQNNSPLLDPGQFVPTVQGGMQASQRKAGVFN